MFLEIFLTVLFIFLIYLLIYFSGGKKTELKNKITNSDKRIMQTLKNKNIPERLAKYINRVEKNNPDYDHYIYDNNDIREYIKNNDPEYLKVFDKIDIGVVKADFFRLFWLYYTGGIYLDIDMISLKPFPEIEDDIDMLLLIDHDKLLVFHFILSEKEIPLIKNSLDLCVDNITNKKYTEQGNNINGYISKICGPEVFTKSFRDYFQEYDDIKEKIYTRDGYKVKVMNWKKYEDILSHKYLGWSYYVDTYRAGQSYWGINLKNISHILLGN